MVGAPREAGGLLADQGPFARLIPVTAKAPAIVWLGQDPVVPDATSGVLVPEIDLQVLSTDTEVAINGGDIACRKETAPAHARF